jgi:hypothetical protein
MKLFEGRFLSGGIMNKALTELTVILFAAAFLIAVPIAAQNIELIGSMPTEYSHGVYVVGQYAYVADYYCGLRVVDVSDPTDPVQVGYASLPLLRALHVSDGILAGCAVDLYILDVSDPYHPHILSVAYVPGWAQFAQIEGNIVYVGSGSHGLSFVDISNPDSAFLMDNYYTPGAGEEVQVDNGIAYLADYDRGLEIIDIADLDSVDIIGRRDTPDLAIGVFVSGPYSFLANMEAGLQIMDISNMADPIVIGHYDTPGEAQDVFIQGGYAFIADRYSGLRIVNIINPQNPLYVDSYDTPGMASCVFVRGKFIYLTDGPSFMIFQFGGQTDAEENSRPRKLSLGQNYPNPFNANTTISYDLVRECDVVIDIYDVFGQKVEMHSFSHQSSGPHSLRWEAGSLPSGVYFYKISTDNYTEVKKCLLLK